MIHNFDTYYEANINDFLDLLIETMSFELIPCFEVKGEQWSLAKPSIYDSKLAVEVREKYWISNNCSVGIYLFKSTVELVSLS